MQDIQHLLIAATNAMTDGRPSDAANLLVTARDSIDGTFPVRDHVGLSLALARAQAAAGQHHEALKTAMVADAMATPVAAQYPALRVETLAAATECAVTAGNDEASVTLGGFLTSQALNAKDLENAVAGAVIQAEALLRLGRDSAALDTARLGVGQAARLGDEARRGWLGRAAMARAAAASRLGRSLEARTALGIAASESVPAPDQLSLMTTLHEIEFHGVTATSMETLRELCHAAPPRVRAAALMALFDIALRDRDTEVATQLLSTLAEFVPDDGLLRARVSLALANRDASAALEKARAYVEHSPSCEARLLLSDALLLSDEPVDAFGALDDAVDLAAGSGDTQGVMRARFRRSMLALHLGDTDGARADARAGIEIARTLQSPQDIATGHGLVARALLVQDLADEALSEIDEGISEVERIGGSYHAGKLGLIFAFAANAWPEADADGRDAERALADATRSRDIRLAAVAHLALAPRVHAAGDIEGARDHLGRAAALDARLGLNLATAIHTTSERLGLVVGSA